MTGWMGGPWSEEMVEAYLDAHLQTQEAIDDLSPPQRRYNSWGSYVNDAPPGFDIHKAHAHDIKMTRYDPVGALAWDRKADERQKAWEESPFAETVVHLFGTMTP